MSGSVRSEPYLTSPSAPTGAPDLGLPSPLAKALVRALKPHGDREGAPVPTAFNYQYAHLSSSSSTSSSSSDPPTPSSPRTSASVLVLVPPGPIIVVAPAVVALLDQAWREVASVVQAEILEPLRCEASLHSGGSQCSYHQQEEGADFAARNDV